MNKVICLATLALFVGTSSTYALELPIGLKPGKNKNVPRVRGAVTVAGDYTDNVDTSAGRDSKGLRLRVTPEMSLELPSFLEGRFGKKKLYVFGTYKYGYLGVSGKKTDFHRNGHHAKAGARYKISNRASLGSNYTFQRDQYPFATAGDTYGINRVDTALKVKLTDRLTVMPYHKFENFNDTGLDDDALAPFNDYGDNAVGMESEYSLSKKVSLVSRSEYQNRESRDTDTKDFHAYSSQGGLSLRLSPKMTVTGTGGYTRRSFDLGKGKGSAIWDLKMLYLPRSKVTVAGWYKYDLRDTFITDFLDFNGSGAPSLNAFIDREFRAITVQRIGTNIGWELSDADRLDTKFEFQHARAKSSQDVGSSTPQKLLDKTFEFSVNYAHAFSDWMRLILGYSLIGKNSITADDFRANTVSFGLRLGW